MSNVNKDMPSATRRTWVKPVIRQIHAGSAEVGTRQAGDGNFTTS